VRDKVSLCVCVPGSVPLSDICKPPDDIAHSRIFSTESNVERVHQSQSPVSGKVPVSVSHGTCTNYCRTRSCFQQSHRGLYGVPRTIPMHHFLIGRLSWTHTSRAGGRAGYCIVAFVLAGKFSELLLVLWTGSLRDLTNP
jgi:hypothetical protein